MNPSEAVRLAEEAYELANGNGYKDLVAKISSIRDSVRRAAESGSPVANGGASAGPGAAQAPLEQRELSISELREKVVNALKRELWETAETHLERLFKHGEPVETIAPDLVTALLNARPDLTQHATTRIESLIAQLEAGGHAAIATPLREKLAAKRAASEPKKSRWKLW